MLDAQHWVDSKHRLVKDTRNHLWPLSELSTCCFWSLSSQKKTIDGDWVGSERFEVALWGHVSQGNHI